MYLAHVAVLRGETPPQTLTQLRSFFGFANVYRRFFALKGEPLYELLAGQPKSKKHVQLPALNNSQLEAFDVLVKAVTEPPVLALPKADLPYSVDADSSVSQIGGALFQTYEGNIRKPIGFWRSKKECLAVVCMLTTRHYILGEQFKVYTDHARLSWLMKIVDPATR